MPNVTGYFKGGTNFYSTLFGDGYNVSAYGAFYLGGYHTGEAHEGGSGYYSPSLVGIDASRSSAIYGASETVQPASYTVRYYIRAK